MVARVRQWIGPPKSRHRKIAIALFIGANVAYAVTRVVIVFVSLRKYGVDPVTFGLIEMVSTLIYSVGAAHAVQAFADGTGATDRFATYAGLGFIAPDIYVLASGTRLPLGVVLVFACIVSMSLFSVARHIRARRRLYHERQQAAHEPK